MGNNPVVPKIPLAERIRPAELNLIRGHEKLLGKNGPLRKMIEQDNLSSFILWGRPGSGKTTIAKLISSKTNSVFYSINAVSSGVKDIRGIIEQAKIHFAEDKRTILFIDEIHRFNKAQQDALLSAVESGELILIGATTENPSFEIIPALRSRMRIFVLADLSEDDLSAILDHALKNDPFLSGITFTVIDRDYLIYASGGDARLLLNILEAAVIQNLPSDTIALDKTSIDEALQRKNTLYDKGGEEHYNIISAFIKSLRGSDPDAALYWMARMLEGGEDPLFIARRMLVLAAEDIGNASPNALVLAEAAFSAVEKVGMPESRIILAQCATYLAGSPKSNASYMAIEKAYGDVRNKAAFPVPLRFRNAPTSFMKKLDYGKEYQYAHKFENNFIEENYFPDELESTQYYFPGENGQEKKIKEYLKFLWRKRKKYP